MSGDELDEAIDRGLRDYVAREPPFGMEVRVLRQAQRRDSRALLAWAAAACLLAGILTPRMWQRPVERLVVRPVSARIEVPPSTRVRNVRRKPGITAGERALLRFVKDHPEQALEAFAKRDDSITVAEIEIAPLAIELLEPQEEKQK